MNRIIKNKYDDGRVTYTVQKNKIFGFIPWFWNDCTCYYDNGVGIFVEPIGCKAEFSNLDEAIQFFNYETIYKKCNNKIIFKEEILKK